ncbi:TPA: ABC transporter ATP-binding protein [Streptococcus suis]|uniref:ABC transporter ATP-binding protein n=2 Tax=Streptococcus TaxID=1301 RepID=A0A4T2GP55_STRSU|nr:ABC transporter ATP-binding protein [Streptococcus sp. 29896]MBL6537610.1 ABC transporter ATP-binding protein [Streptococcus suis]MBM7269761.1 ABC transporter ATP-binding protein [Streptococcus suis]MBM7315052.1 ABC transporter ATP-binding protein [Streptococcus suis]MCK4026875.1 ABC transporter ATP-binding protein [Streptococcus suis]TIH99660.1 ABC transporter ATP-binding protein [Streptococcus suis]
MLEVKNLTGGYANIPVLKDVSFQVGDGELVGLIGLNGAGKSTTIKEIIGLLQPYGGTIKVNDLELSSDLKAYRKQIAYIPESPILYEELTLREHIELLALAYELDKEAMWQKADGLLQLFRLQDKLDWFPSTFSKGMMQKVMIICALLLEASLLIVDEPFLGLDPLAISDLVSLLEKEKALGRSILMSTHVLDSAERLCDRFVVLHSGQVIADGDLGSLRQQFDMPDASLNDIYLTITASGVTG